MKIEIPNDVKQIMSELNNHSFEAYIVGGCVRDSLLGVTPKDYDVTTNATPDNMKEIFVNYHLIPTGEPYGTMTVMLNHVGYEITTFRSDGSYGDGRRPDSVSFSGNIKDDLSRRDLTINAMAYNDNSGLIDMFGGYKDLKNQMIKCAGNPIDRFNEDSLRIMRAIRFAVHLDFDISKETVEAIWECGENLKNVSQERKRDELVKILKGIRYLRKDSLHYLKLRGMVEYIIKRIMPEFQELAQVTHNNPWHFTDVISHTLEMLFMADTDDIEILLTVLLHDIGKMKARVFDEKRLTNHYDNHAVFSVAIAKGIMERLRFDSKTIERVLLLVEGHDDIIQNNRKCAKKLLNQLGHRLCLKLLQVQLLDKKTHRWNRPSDYQQWASDVCEIQKLWCDIIENNEAFKIGDLAINGHDLIEIGFEPGRKIGEVLRQCLEYVIDNPDKNNRDDLMAYVKISLTSRREKPPGTL